MTWFSGAVRNAHRLSNSIGVFRNLGWLVAIVAGGGLAVWQMARTAGGYVTAAAALAGVGIGALITGLLLIRRASVPSYSWESAEYEFRFDPSDPRHQVQFTKIKIRANRDDVILFRNSYLWTGKGASHLQTLNGHRVVAEGVVVDSQRQYYRVLLERPLNRGDTAVIKIRQEFFDEDRKFQPVLAKNINEPVGKLTLRVIFPVELEPRQVVSRELVRSRSSESGWRTVHERNADLEKTGDASEVVYEASGPRVGRRYDISWEPWTKYAQSP